MNEHTIRAFTPIILAVVGLLIGILTIYGPIEEKAAGFGLAGTAIAGAAGLAEKSQ